MIVIYERLEAVNRINKPIIIASDSMCCACKYFVLYLGLFICLTFHMFCTFFYVVLSTDIFSVTKHAFLCASPLYVILYGFPGTFSILLHVLTPLNSLSLLAWGIEYIPDVLLAHLPAVDLLLEASLRTQPWLQMLKCTRPIKK